MVSEFLVSSFFEKDQPKKIAPRLVLVNRQGLQDFRQAPGRCKDQAWFRVWNLKTMDDKQGWFCTDMESLQYDMCNMYIYIYIYTYYVHDIYIYSSPWTYIRPWKITTIRWMFVDLGAYKHQLVLGCSGQPHHRKTAASPSSRPSKPSITWVHAPQHWIHQSKKKWSFNYQFTKSWFALHLVLAEMPPSTLVKHKTSLNSWDIWVVISPIQESQGFHICFHHFGAPNRVIFHIFIPFPLEIIQLLGPTMEPPRVTPAPKAQGVQGVRLLRLDHARQPRQLGHFGRLESLVGKSQL